MYVEMLSSCVPRNGSMPLFSVSIINLAFGQDGWPMQVPFFCLFMERDGVEIHKSSVQAHFVTKCRSKEYNQDCEIPQVLYYSVLMSVISWQTICFLKIQSALSLYAFLSRRTNCSRRSGRHKMTHATVSLNDKTLVYQDFL